VRCQLADIGNGLSVWNDSESLDIWQEVLKMVELETFRFLRVDDTPVVKKWVQGSQNREEEAKYFELCLHKPTTPSN
jgi:hypothetical protein